MQRYVDIQILCKMFVNLFLYVLKIIRLAGNSQATMSINIKPRPGEFPSSEEIDKPMNQQDPGIYICICIYVCVYCVVYQLIGSLDVFVHKRHILCILGMNPSYANSQGMEPSFDISHERIKGVHNHEMKRKQFSKTKTTTQPTMISTASSDKHVVVCVKNC